MGKLIYMLNVSLDGYVETPERGLEWTVIDEELHGWFNDQTRRLDASLYGRRMYELMAAYWPTADEDPTSTPVEREFAEIWKRMPKIVFSSTLQTVDWNSRLARADIGDELAKLRTEFQGDLDVGGATLASAFIQRRLVDEYRLVVHPVILGAGNPFFPQLDSSVQLRLTDSHRFESGVTYLAYTATSRDD